MHKLLVFDLDGTLAAIGKGIEDEALTLLRELEDAGYQIVICSGKTTFYLCGFMRQVGLKAPVLIGENGANIQFGVELPPERFYLYPYSKEAKEQIQEVKEAMLDLVGEDIWVQPNVVGFTPFPKNEEVFEKIAALLEQKKEELKDVIVYRHVDSFDITPKEINKYNGLRFLSELMGTGPEDMVAIGDGVNDVPMFAYADISIGIGSKLEKETDICFENIADALHYIKNKKI